ncbi:PAS-domain containing protein [Niveispirillum sp.]|uniref:PAS-domain containing protein n=1 Tax=Niveispirillum sp. TaxID=1917217 RepID=UPI001B603674|nr:PAS-domain containing protein [Niveispirillum sp.]MBP7336445.1 PAS-domain containing protein [Niveispirillum sp.]
MDLDSLTTAFDMLTDGVALFDAQERLVLANPAFRALFPVTADRMQPGVTFETLLRFGIDAGDNLHAQGRDVEDYVAERLRGFRHPTGQPGDFLLSDGRWIRVQDRALPQGGTLCVRTDITELKRRESELRDSEQRYRQLVDLSPDGIAVHDAQGRGRFVNRAGRAILGIAAEEPAARFNVLDVTNEETRPLAEMLMRRVVSGEPLRQMRIDLRRMDGRDITVELSAVPFQGGGERLVMCLFRDVTHEAASSLRLRESEARARSILDTALDCIISIDEDGYILEFNPAAERTFGWQRAEAVGQRMSDLIVPPQHRSGHDSGLMRMKLGSGGTMLGRRVEIEALRRDGRLFPVELAITAVPLGPGQRYTAYLRDITDRRQAEHEIWEKTRILDSMMDNVGIGIEVYDANGHLLVANRMVSELLDIPAGFMKPGLKDRDLVRLLAQQGEYPGESVEESLTDYDRIRHDGICFNERQRPNGTWLQVRHFPMPGGGFVVLFADVTEQKKLESQLLQAQKMEALGQLAGGIAHDFNNILSVIGGYASMAKQGVPKDAPQAGYLAKIGQGVERAAALTRELLTFSRQKVARTEVIDLGDVLRGQEFLLKPLLGATIDLSLLVPDAPVWVAVDPDMIAQALLNLAINARDAMPGGGPLIVRLGLAAEPAPPGLETGDYALLSVTDRGTGMPPELLDRIFDPFFTTKPPGQGTGLGLAMVYGTVKQAGGVILVDSQPGRGTCFTLWLPLSPPPAEEGRADAPMIAAATTRPATILVAEDEPELLTLVAGFLEREGHAVRRAADGVEALERFEEGGIDLLLTDLVMPALGGVRLAHLVTELDPSVTVLFMTGYPGRGHVEVEDLPPDIPVLYKPVEPETLCRAVAEALAKRRSA